MKCRYDVEKLIHAAAAPSILGRLALVMDLIIIKDFPDYDGNYCKLSRLGKLSSCVEVMLNLPDKRKC